MHRFFLPPENIKGELVIFPELTARQMRNVLRLKPGDLVVVLDNKGNQFDVQLGDVGLKIISGKVMKKTAANGEPIVKVHLYFSLTQREKMEWIFQKCTEIGVKSFTPFISTYSLAREKGVDASKVRRWEKIIQEAAEQCERGRIPALNDVMPLPQAIKKVTSRKEISLVAWEGEHQVVLRESLQLIQARVQVDKKVNVFIGPEGGFTEMEVAAFQKAGINTFSLGKRIFRMETAAMIASALILIELEDTVR